MLDTEALAKSHRVRVACVDVILVMNTQLQCFLAGNMVVATGVLFGGTYLMWPQGPSSGLYLTYIQKVAIPRRKQSVNKNNEISFRSDLFGILSLRPLLALAAPTAHKLSQKSDCKVLLVKKT